MVILAPTVLNSSGSGTDASVFTTPMVSPDPGDLLVLFVDAGSVVTTDNVVPTITDTLGLTWTQRDTAQGFGGTYIRGTIFTAPAPDGDAGTISIHFSQQQSSCHWHLIRVKGANLDAPVVQTVHQAFNTAQNPSVSFPAPPLSTSLVLGFVYRNGTTPYTAGPGHVILSSQAGHSNPAIGSDVSYDMAPAGQSVGFTTASAAQKTVFGIEIAVGGAVAPPPTTEDAVLIRKWKDVNVLATNTIPITVPANLTVGQTLVASLVRVTGATVNQITGITGIGANVATVAAHAVRASTMITETIVIPITEQINAGSTITVTIAGGSPSRKAFVCSVWEGITGEVNATSGTAGADGSGLALSATTTGPVTVTKSLVIGSFGKGGTQLFTPDPGNTEVDEIATTAGSTDRGIVQQYRVDASPGTEISSGTVSATSAWSGNVVAIPLSTAAAGAPNADAGGNQSGVEPGEVIELSASDSTASGPMTYIWEQISGEPVNYTTAGPDLTVPEAPWTIAGTTLVFRVTVTSEGLSSTAEVSVAVLASEGRIMINGFEVPLKTVQVG